MMMEEETNKTTQQEEEIKEPTMEEKIEDGTNKEEEREEERAVEAVVEDSKSCDKRSSIYLDNDTSAEKKKKTKKPQPTMKRLTRAERARQEALSSFGGQDLASVVVKKRDLRQELHQDVNSQKQGNSAPLRQKPTNKKVNSSEGLKGALFGGGGAGGVGERRKRKLDESSYTAVAQPATVTMAQPPSQKVSRRITKAEQARIDALKSFGGCGFDDVLATSRKRIAKTFEMKEENKEEVDEGEEEEEEEEMEEKEGMKNDEEEKENVSTAPSALEV